MVFGARIDLTAWQLALALAGSGCSTTVSMGRDITLLPLMVCGLEFVVLFVLTVLLVLNLRSRLALLLLTDTSCIGWERRTICLRLRYKLSRGVVVHIISILLCLAMHFAWKCVRDWTAFQLYLDGAWDHATEPFTLNGYLEDLARRIRKDAEDPTLFYLLGVVPLV